MNQIRIFLPVLLCVAVFLHASAQNKKFDKSLKKVDAYYTDGSYDKASKSLRKLKSAIVAKMGQHNAYMPGLYMREARLNLASGILTGFDNTLENAINSSLTIFGENSTHYPATLIEVAELYNEYGNFRIARNYLDTAEESLAKAGQLTDALKGRIVLVKAEAMIGQGFCNDAIALLESNEKYFAARAVEKETLVVNGAITTRRVPADELPGRFNAYARLKMLIGNAYAQKGRISIPGANEENPDVEVAFHTLDNWMRGKKKLLGEASLIEVHYKYLWAKALVDNGNRQLPSELAYDKTLYELKKKTNPTNALAHSIYLSYLEVLFRDENRGRYTTRKLEYERMIDKYYPKSSLHQINLKAIEFNAKLSKEKTKDLEKEALIILNEESLPKNYKTTLHVLGFLYEIALAEKRYSKAEEYLRQITETKKELCGERSPEYHLSLITLANFYLDYTNKIEEAGKIYTDSYLSFIASEIGEQHKDLLDILNHLARWYELTDKYGEASTVLKAAKDAANYKFDKEDILFARELNNIAKLQLKLGEFDQAEGNIQRALTIVDLKQNKEYKEWRPTYISVLESQAKLYGIKGMFDEAEDNLDRSGRLIAKAKNTIVTSELSTAEELTALLIQLGRFSEADRLLNLQIPEYEKLFGNASLRLIEPLVNKGRILLAKGDYTEAERIASRAHQLALKTYAEKSTKTAPTQKLLSDIYYTLGDFDKAEIQITKALASQEKQFGRSHIEVAKSLSQLALIKFHKGDDRRQVEQLMLEARDIVAAKLGKDNPQYAELLKNVAVLYISEHKFDVAFNALSVAEAIWRAKTGTKNNINAAGIYTLTGDVYYQQKNYKKSEEFYIKAKDLYEKFFSAAHPEYVKVLSKLSKVYYMQKDYKRSKRLIEESLAQYESFIKQFFPALSEREKAKYWNTIKGDFEFYNTLAFGNLEEFKDLAGKVYNYQLLTKALLLSSSIKIRERIQNSTDDALKAQYSDWIQKKELLTLALSMSPAQLTESEIDPAVLHQEVERLEKELSQKSELFGQSFENKRLTFEEVKKSLKDNEVAVEMVRYRHFDHNFTDSVIYAAIYLRNEFAKPKVVMLKDGKKMETRYFKYYRNSITGKIPDAISYGIFWQPISEEIGQASTLYLSADGIYNQINLEAIATPDGRFVIDNANVVLVSNTKDLYIRKIKSKVASTENTASMFGNPTFYLTASAGQSIASLPGTQKEVNEVQFMLKQKGWITAEYVEQRASEEKIKELNSPKIFHIATHGFYRSTEQVTLQEEIEGNEAVLTQNPLMRTGLLLKGAGDLMEKTSYNYNMENGILTAYEAMSLNLDKTDLVVLSACETGLGDLEAGEGVYGLQRAFLVAGAKVLVMSMFKVDDEATQKLMLKFYQKWLNSGNLRQSFTDAKKELRTEYPDPIYWGAFMMIGLD